ncbi:MAG TPA: tetracycline resistance MFS efflux pump [Gammaproteobacteria bacterium]|jgi:DHA1 family tetracycline resistance protein-like MFS transporter|nr:tetracycline resistance MFS efflux pump [Gammaproteobacteria bacterium]
MTDSTTKPSRYAKLFIIATVTLDAMGIGLIMPVIPDLIRQIQHVDLAQAAFWGGLLSFTYAFMQFVCGPLIGNLSDRFGRRPVLILSLVFMGLDYFLMAIAPTLLLLFIARTVSGVTGATYATAAAYLTDISKKGERSQNFGLLGAAFGIGFVLGPAIGGLLGELGTRMPFIAAGILALANALFGYFVLPETLEANKRRVFEWRRANPFNALLRLKNLPAVGALMLVVLIYSTANSVYPSVWSYFTIEQFGWTVGLVGISLAIYGVSSALVQIFALPKLVQRFGERKSAAIGIVIAAASFGFLAIVENGWLVFMTMPVTALGGIVGPCLQGLMADRVADNEQGELQGVFSSVVAISMIVSPLLMTYVFKRFTETGTSFYLPGAPFAVAGILAIASLLILWATARPRDQAKRTV